MAFNKVGGVTNFYPNRSIKGSRQVEQNDLVLYNNGNTFQEGQEYKGQAIVVGAYTLYNDSKTDIYIRPNTDLSMTGGYLIDNTGNDLFVYEAIEVNTSDDVLTSGYRPYINIKATNDAQLQEGDSIWLNGVQYTMDTTKTTFTPVSGPTPASFGIGDPNSVSLSQQFTYITSQINASVTGYDGSIISTSSNNGINIYLSDYNSSRDTEQIYLDFSQLNIKVNDGSIYLAPNTYRVTPFQRIWQLKNCFIPSEQYQYAHNSAQGNSVNKTECVIANNASVKTPNFLLQLTDDPTFTYGAYFLQTETVNAKLRWGFVVGIFDTSYTEFELVKAPGSAGNSYTFQVQDHPDLNTSNGPGSSSTQVDFPPQVIIRNNGVDDINGTEIILQLGKSGPGTRITVANFLQLQQAFREGGLDPDEWIRLIIGNQSGNLQPSFTAPSVVYSFEGGVDVGSELIEEPGFEFSNSQILKKYYPESYGLSSELDSLGRDRIVDNDAPAERDGQHGGFFTNVVPAGTAFRARKDINFIEYTAVTGGLSGNNIAVIYQNTGSLSVTDGVDTVTITIDDNITTAQEIADAVNLNSALITARVFGNASQPQNSILALSPGVNLEDGLDASVSDSGFFVTERQAPSQDSVNIDINSSTSRNREMHVYHFSDIADSSTFSFVASFPWEASESSSGDDHEGIMEFSRRYDSTSGLLTISLGNIQRDLRPQNARLNYSANTRIESLTKGFAGNNEYTVEITTGAGVGLETAVLEPNGVDITINVSPSSTVQDIIDAITANNDVNTKIQIVTSDTNESMTVGKPRLPLQNGCELWNFPGRLGFGYVNIDEMEHYQSTDQNPIWGSDSTRLSPLSFSTRSVAIKYFRGIDLSGAE